MPRSFFHSLLSGDSEDGLVHLLVVPDEQPVSDPHGGGAQFPGPAQQERFRIGRQAPAQVVGVEPTPAGDNEFRDPFEQRHRVGTDDRIPVRVRDFSVLDPVFRKKLLRSPAARSTRTVVAPRHGSLAHHQSSIRS